MKTKTIMIGKDGTLIVPVTYTNVPKGLYEQPALNIYNVEHKINYNVNTEEEIMEQAIDIIENNYPDVSLVFHRDALNVLDESIKFLKKINQKNNN
jgi:hypothetical protein